MTCTKKSNSYCIQGSIALVGACLRSRWNHKWLHTEHEKQNRFLQKRLLNSKSTTVISKTIFLTTGTVSRTSSVVRFLYSSISSFRFGWYRFERSTILRGVDILFDLERTNAAYFSLLVVPDENCVPRTNSENSFWSCVLRVTVNEICA